MYVGGVIFEGAAPSQRLPINEVTVLKIINTETHDFALERIIVPMNDNIYPDQLPCFHCYWRLSVCFWWLPAGHSYSTL
jgi:hypothetical protein